MCDRQQFNKALHNSLQFACCLNECREEKTYRLVSPALCQPTPSPAESESEAWLLLWLRSITLPPNEAMDGLGMTRLIFSYPFRLNFFDHLDQLLVTEASWEERSALLTSQLDSSLWPYLQPAANKEGIRMTDVWKEENAKEQIRDI